ncbi:serine/threonine-protein kinase [Streptomyces mayteni]
MATVVPILIGVVVAVLAALALVRRRSRRRQLVAGAPAGPARPSFPTPAPAPLPPSRPGTPPTASPDSAILSTDRFTLLEGLGRGGMGVVWRARDNVLGRQVAIKQLLPAADAAPQVRATTRARMLREARAAARLDHPGAVTVHDVLLDHDSVLIVMELVRATTLAVTIRNGGPLPLRRVAAIGRDLLDVLMAAHELGIVHRDVKPANVLLPPDGSVKLADFGIAELAGDPTLTTTGAVLGTPTYMAPEQLRGLTSSPATDLWGLGATLYHAVEGQPAFGGPGPMAALAAVLTDPPAAPRRAGKLAPLLVGLLAKEPQDRPAPTWLRAELAELALQA